MVLAYESCAIEALRPHKITETINSSVCKKATKLSSVGYFFMYHIVVVPKVHNFSRVVQDFF